jgi:hypothetical protein
MRMIDMACEKCEYCDRIATQVATFTTQDIKGRAAAQRRYLCNHHAELMKRVVERKGYGVAIRNKLP